MVIFVRCLHISTSFLVVPYPYGLNLFLYRSFSPMCAQWLVYCWSAWATHVLPLLVPRSGVMVDGWFTTPQVHQVGHISRGRVWGWWKKVGNIETRYDVMVLQGCFMFLLVHICAKMSKSCSFFQTGLKMMNHTGGFWTGFFPITVFEVPNSVESRGSRAWASQLIYSPRKEVAICHQSYR